ncbi:MAG: glycosyltransferase family 2 protein, partial [Chitinophagales bacterium]
MVITFNESANIARCLDSVKNIADEILVVDSYSTDDTVAISESKGARILKHPFEGYIKQRGYAVAKAKFDCILALDADECISKELEESILAVKLDWRYDCYSMNRLNAIGGQWIRYGAWYPDRKMRLFNRQKA